MYNTKEGKTCVIYIRVSSERQVKGYSLDGQKHYLAECAERRGMTVLDTYVEEGKSGKSIEGRTEFQRMLDDIQSGKVHTDYVLVFKLSRFGRNARDVLNSLEFIMKYGVHLMCVEDGLDSSTSMGKMMITILGAVAELERENIIAQSLLGREEKAKSGGWNGGFAPYGYRLVKGDDKSKGKLETVPEEKAVVQLVFDMFLNRNMGYTAISGYLNRNGYTRPPAKNAIRPSYGEWSSDHIKRMLSNPVYTGRVAWGKRRTEKVPGSDNEYRLVKQDEYILSEVISHEEFVSKEDFDRVQEIKAIRGKKGNHNIGQYNAHLLSGIVKCPQCGAPMYIGMTKWTNQDGTERRTESYVCSYATKHRGTSVCRRNGVVASQVEDEVMEYTRKIVRNPQFIKDLQEKVMTAVDMTEVENDITAYKNQLSALQRSRDSLERDIDRIAPDDKYAERRRADMTRRLNDLYDQIYKAEDLLQESTMKKATLESEQMSVQSMIGILSSFDAIYDRMNAAERRDLVKYLISEVELFPREEQKTQKRFVKAIAYKFPIEQKVLTQFDECGASVETDAFTLKNPTRPGYTFTGWSGTGLTGEDNLTVTIPKGSTGNRSYTAHWSLNTYSITYDLNGGTASGNPTSYTVESATITLNQPTKTGYTFTGWSGTDLTGEDNLTVTIPAGSTGDRSYTAHWSLNTYSITYDLNGGTVSGNPDFYTVESAAITLNQPTRIGYTFTGWSGTNLTGEDNLTVTIPAGSIGNRSYTAHWSLNTYSIAYDLDGGTAFGNPDSYTVESAAITLNEPAKAGYVFTGWSGTDLVGEDNLTVTIPAGSIGDRRYTAHWEFDPTIIAALNPTPNVDFLDVSRVDWFYYDVRYVCENGLMNGTSRNRFSPYGTATRGMLVTILYRMENEPRCFGSAAFSDVKPGAYYEKAVVWASQNNIVSGYTDGTFRPDAPVTREQLASILYRYTLYRGQDVSAGETTSLTGYGDAQAVSSYALPAMRWACGTGILQGANGKLNPSGLATRAQLAAMLHRYLTK